MSNYHEYVVSDVERMALTAWLEHGSIKKAANALGKSKTAIQEAVKRVKDRASLQGYAPDKDMVHTAPDTHFVKGTSTLYKEGEAVLQWVKTDKKSSDQYEIMREAVEALAEDLPRIKTTTSSVSHSADLLAVYPMGDPHLGLLCWGEETGDNHNLEIGVSDLCNAIHRLVNTAPSCKQALIINTGDYFHSDTMDNMTRRSGHHLDVDGRWMKIMRAGIKAMRQCIESALEKHEHVTVINVIGNHDDHSSMFLSVCLANVYENESRVTINDAPTATHYYKFGKNLIGTHHGNNIKADKLPLVMATERPIDWGDSQYRVWYTGHVHHDSVKEYNGCTVETVRTLAGKDAYAVSHGYSAHRDMKCVVHHREYGEIERHTVGVPMVRA